MLSDEVTNIGHIWNSVTYLAHKQSGDILCLFYVL